MNPRTLILPALTLSVLLAACSKTPRSAGALPHEVYVWQRVWSPAVSGAVDEGKNDVARYAVLAAEIAGGEVARPAIDWAALRNSGRPVALVLRLGKNDIDGQRAEIVTRLAMQLFGDAQENGVTASELQIDYDCAESKLGGYRALLQKLRDTVPLTVTPTALPSWLKQPEFAALARESGGFVLQVHSTSAPKLGVEKICSPSAARRWVGQAGRLGVPFRVALPTYRYLTAFDARGKFLGI
ncbi:MAG: DUF3142 domain-containing protein, partial [Verrucomicrobiales bacterium]|nr:DUF3142 domain-containing protein [Verrucomicrobiales bacterium]